MALSATGIVIVLARKLKKRKPRTALRFANAPVEPGIDWEKIKFVASEQMAVLRQQCVDLSQRLLPLMPQVAFAMSTEMSGANLSGKSISSENLPSAVRPGQTSSSATQIQNPLRFRDSKSVRPVVTFANQSAVPIGPTSQVTESLDASDSPVSVVCKAESETSDGGWLDRVPGLATVLMLFCLLGVGLGLCGLFADSPAAPLSVANAANVHSASMPGPMSSRLNLDAERLMNAGIENPGQIKAIPIRDIQVGMRVPAHNPEMTDAEKLKEELGISHDTWRKFVFDVDKADGTGIEKIELLRPSAWLVEKSILTSIDVATIVEEEYQSQPIWFKTADEVLAMCSAEYWQD